MVGISTSQVLHFAATWVKVLRRWTRVARWQCIKQSHNTGIQLFNFFFRLAPREAQPPNALPNVPARHHPGPAHSEWWASHGLARKSQNHAGNRISDRLQDFLKKYVAFLAVFCHAFAEVSHRIHICLVGNSKRHVTCVQIAMWPCISRTEAQSQSKDFAASPARRPRLGSKFDVRCLSTHHWVDEENYQVLLKGLEEHPPKKRFLWRNWWNRTSLSDVFPSDWVKEVCHYPCTTEEHCGMCKKPPKEKKLQ